MATNLAAQELVKRKATAFEQLRPAFEQFFPFVQQVLKPSDQPGNRSWRVLESTVPPGPFAEHVIDGYVELTAPEHNNPASYVRFVDLPERSNTETM